MLMPACAVKELTTQVTQSRESITIRDSVFFYSIDTIVHVYRDTFIYTVNDTLMLPGDTALSYHGREIDREKNTLKGYERRGYEENNKEEVQDTESVKVVEEQYSFKDYMLLLVCFCLLLIFISKISKDK